MELRLPSSSPPPAAETSFADVPLWARRLDLARTFPGTGLQAELPHRLPGLKNRFRQLLRDTKAAVHETAGDSDKDLIAPVARACLELSKLVHAELAAVESGDRPVAPLGMIQQLLDQNAELLERLRRQLTLLQLATSCADDLHLFLTAVVRGRQQPDDWISFDSLTRIARRLLAQSPADQVSALTGLLPGLVQARFTSRFQDPVRAAAYRQGIGTALSVSRTARTVWLKDSLVEHLVAAALLQDCGTLVLATNVAARRSGPDPLQHPQHPRVGAALLGGVPQAPPAVLRLVAEHHEQLDGLGQPCGLRSERLGELQRLLAAAVRFEELRGVHATTADVAAAPGLADLDSAAQLLEEARQGRWDLDMVQKLLVDCDADRLALRLRQRALPVSEPRELAAGVDAELAALARTAPPAEAPPVDGQHELPAPRFGRRGDKRGPTTRHQRDARTRGKRAGRTRRSEF